MAWRVNGGVVVAGKGWGCDGGVWRSDCGFGAWRSVMVVRGGCLLIVEMTKSATCGLTRGWRVEPRITAMKWVA